MNGIHDLGGMQGFGPIEREENEPVFHADWERRMFALLNLTIAMQGFGPIEREERNPPCDRADGAGRIPDDAILRALAPCG
jgi:Nitrile hydratase beta subunit